MRFFACLICLSFLARPLSFSQDTFSIVAVDTVTGEIGSAGASCVGGGVGAFILSDVLEGIGAIHTQASYLSSNQQTARGRMVAGDSPQQIIDWMVAHDAQNNPTVRQYGVVDLRRRGETAAYTGVNCLNYKNHAIGPGYSVQGNILLGQMIIDTIRNTFLRTPGALADRLMLALEAAKIIGADTRCASRGTSSQSAFIKVVRIGDGAVPYLQRVIGNSAINVDPIGLLKTAFDRWKDSLRLHVDPFRSQLTVTPETLRADGSSFALIRIFPKNNSDSLLAGSRRVLLSNTGGGALTLPDTNYTARLIAPATPGVDTISARVVDGSDTTSVFAKRIVYYTQPTGTTAGDGSIPATVVLHPNFPNPFNPTTMISYGIPSAGHVTVNLYDVLGRHILTLLDETQPAGYHTLTADLSQFGSGVYFYCLEAGSSIFARKMVLVQ
ncbi:MAG: DUF1028 domain-containing protein [Ignavibacteriae bacterium]|nr:DUF1028 domain-containing protein [Ignavibacteriota bacterium]